MTRLLLLAWLVAAAAIIASNVHAYSARENAGIYITLPAGHWCGIEYRGTPGAFCDQD